MANLLSIFYRLTVPEYLVVTFFSFFSALFLINSENPITLNAIITFISLSIAVLALNSFNQVYDLKSDKVDKPNRPLVTKEISVKQVMRLSYFMFLLSIIFSLLVSFNLFIITLSFIAVSIAYSAPPIRLKRLPLSGIFVGTYLHGVVPFISAIIISSNVNPVYAMIFGLFFILLAFSASSLKDLEDLEGDRNSNTLSLPLLIGTKRTKLFILFLFALSWLYLSLSLLFKFIPPLFSYSLAIYGILLFPLARIIIGIKKGTEATHSKSLTLIMILIAAIELILAINSKVIV